jgi:hypothetical protein
VAANPYTLNALGAAKLYVDNKIKLDVKNASGASLTGYPMDNLDYVYPYNADNSPPFDDADTLDTYHASTTPGANIIPVGDANGRIAWGAKPAFRGCRAYADVSTISLSSATDTPIPFDAENYDTDAIHSNVTNNSRFTVPSGVTKVRVLGNITIAGNANGNCTLKILKNNSDLIAYTQIKNANAYNGINIDSGVITCVAGDYFEIVAAQNSGSSLLVITFAGYAWGSLEIIE